jgi:uncharacterized protein YndB with AHSA1/START domain
MALEKRILMEKANHANELNITRIFNAPRERVWEAWTEPQQVKIWWGPKDFTAPFIKIDFHIDGAFLYCMESPEGEHYWSTGVFREIVEPERIVATDSFADDKGNVVPATYYGMSPDLPLEMLLTVTFEEHDGKTRLTVHHVGIPIGEESDLAEAGWNESLDKLAEHLWRTRSAKAA